jgi:UDP-N-acetyl-D-mannosaminuronic acid dehydrogenase
MKIGILGAGFVGLTLAGRLLDTKDVQVLLIENNPERILQLRSGQSYVLEPGLQSILETGLAEKTLSVVDPEANDLFEALFVTIGTPKPSMESDRNFYAVIGQYLENLEHEGILLLRSTVSIGTTIKVKELCLKNSRSDIRVVFAPERTAEGVALEELRRLPQILGADSDAEYKAAYNLLSSLGFFIIGALGSREAELAKLACNTWRDVTFGFSNELARLSGQLGIDLFNVIETANSNYPRAKIPKPGPVGGPCLSKDSYILTSSYKTDSSSSVIMKAREVNERIADDVYKFVSRHITANTATKVVLAGLAFKGKPETNDIRDSFAIVLAEKLRYSFADLQLQYWDPSINITDLGSLEIQKIDELDSKDQILILANNAPFLKLDSALYEYQKLTQNSYIVDLWSNLMSQENLSARVVILGRPSWIEITKHE